MTTHAITRKTRFHSHTLNVLFPGAAVGLMLALACGRATSAPTLPTQSGTAPAAKADAAAVKVDAAIPAYKPVQGVSGAISSAGSDTMVKLMTTWTEDFKKLYPAVTVEVQGKGSSTAPTALIEGTATFGAMSRVMKQQEIDDFEKKFGYKPTAVPVAIDTITVYVHKDNPIQSLTLGQLDAIFSINRKSGAEKDIATWGDLGLTGDWAAKPISLYGRNSVSGTYGYFKEHALAKGDFKDTVKEQPGSSGVVQGVASDKYAIGYSGIGFETADVRAVPLSKDAKGKAFEPSAANAYSGAYPMSRFLYVYVNMKQGAPLDPLRREFLRFVLSQQGQEAVLKENYYPLTAKIAGDAMKVIGLTAGAVEAGTPKSK